MQGNIWIGTEDQGIYCLNSKASPNNFKAKPYTHFTQKDGLGDDNAYALVCDKAGRVWAGTLNHGVSVYNGKIWKTYGPIDGPLGSRVFALAINPVDGGVWGATEAGLFQYRAGKWSYYTRSDGLPSDQANALAFAQDGTLYVGTQCDGIVIASPHNHYQTWQVVPGPAALPNSATGDGLPSALINCLLVSSDNTVYAGTDGGLAWSRDAGATWTFTRGKDWKPKLAGLLHPVDPAPVPPTLVPQNLLAEDYVTCLTEDASGRVWVGHRQYGVEVFDPNTSDPQMVRWVQSGANGVRFDDYVQCLLADGRTAWTGLYGGGLIPPHESLSPDDDPVLAKAATFPPLPLPAKPPTLAELQAMSQRVLTLTTPTHTGHAVYLGEDWNTQGDWIGRYGSRYAVLCAAGSPLNQYVLSDPSYQVTGFAGLPRHDGDGLRSWCHWVQTDDPRVLWNPIAGCRRESEWDDHGEEYPQSNDGPNVWAKVSVPAGLHRLSLYLMNKDGHFGPNRWRDYRIELKAAPSDKITDPDTLPTIAQARVHNFWFGVYEKFLVRGPGVYLMKVGKNGSLNAILQTVMLDKVSGPPTAYETGRSVWYGADTYQKPAAQTLLHPSAVVSAAQEVWDTLESHSDRAGAEALATPYRLLAYRAVLADKTASSSSSLLAGWHWDLSLWNPSERKAFLAGMKSSRQSLLDTNPKFAQGNQ